MPRNYKYVIRQENYLVELSCFNHNPSILISMAQFWVQILNGNNHEEIFVTGCKESDASVKRYYGADKAIKYDYYYVKKPNKFGIKWIIMDKGTIYGDVVASISGLSGFENVRVIKMN